MDKITDAPVFLEFYGKLLTDRQAEIIAMYCDDDYSLSEIAENLKISRQAVHDSIKSGIAALEEFEIKLGLIEKYQERRESAKEITDILTGADFSALDDKAKHLIDLVIKKLGEFTEI